MSEDTDFRDIHYGSGRTDSLEDFILQLQDLILDSSDVRDFLTDMAASP